jgi:hypothetical protein
MGEDRAEGRRQRDEGNPNPSERYPNFSERNPSRVEQIPNPAERNPNSNHSIFLAILHKCNVAMFFAESSLFNHLR